MKKIWLIVLIIVILSFVAGIVLYSSMPEKMITHWNAKGEADGHMNRFWGLFLFPIINLAIFFILWFIPRIDPLKKNVKKFRNYYDWFILLFVVYMTYIYVLTILANFGVIFNMNNMILPAVGILFIYIGILLKKAKRNWFIGIRTPWTLSSDKVWNKTHKQGAILFIISGILAFLGLFFPSYSFWFIIVPILISVVYLLIYSYIIYQKYK